MDVPRDFEMGNLSLAEGSYLCLGQNITLSRPDPGAKLFTELFVRDTEYLNVLNLGVSE